MAVLHTVLLERGIVRDAFTAVALPNDRFINLLLEKPREFLKTVDPNFVPRGPKLSLDCPIHSTVTKHSTGLFTRKFLVLT